MNGRAPNSPETGSHVLPVQNLHPNFVSEREDVRYSSKKIAATRRTTSKAKNPVPRRKPRSSALRPRGGGFFAPALSPASELDPLQRFHLQRHDLRRERRVSELGGV